MDSPLETDSAESTWSVVFEDDLHSNPCEPSILNQRRRKIMSEKRTSFLDLPGELRNEIYAPALRFENSRYLKLKYKFSSNGTVYINEGFPPLYHAVPQLREEILSIYYSENNFRVHLWTVEQRNIFLAWVVHRGRALDGFKHLELIFRSRRHHYELGDCTYTAALLLNFDTSGNLSLPRVTPFFDICPCWVIPLVEEAFKQCASASEVPNQSSKHIALSSIDDTSNLNQILSFALKFCSLRDLPRDYQRSWSSILHQLSGDRHKDLMPCWCDWQDVWSVLGLIECKSV